MDVAMMQPTFLPWQGYFELIFKAERFIFLDDFQFSIQSYHQRNRLFVNKGQIDWYTIPVNKAVSFKMPLNETRINENIPWREKMWKRIQQNYSKATFYSQLKPYIENWLFSSFDSLAAINMDFIKFVCDITDIKREFLYSSRFSSKLQRSERVAELLKWCQADYYYCARGSFSYMFEDGIFPLKKTQVLFQDFSPKPYHQVGSPNEFIPYLSVLDALFNVGPRQTFQLIESGASKWSTWQEMIGQNKNHSLEVNFADQD